MVQLCLVHFSVQVPTWWWYKSSRCLIGTKGLCINFVDIVALMGQYTVKFFLTTLGFDTDNACDFLVGLSSNRRPVLRIVVYQHCHQIVLHWRLKFLITLSYHIFLSSVNSRFKFKALIAKKHKATGFSK